MMKTSHLLARLALPISLVASIAQGATTMATLDLISPTVTSYTEVVNTANDPAPLGEDFARFDVNTSPAGEAIALVQLVPNVGNPEDFAGFVAGNIALIDRGAIRFDAKVINAEAAGASGVLIANTTPSGNGLGVFQGGGDFSSTTIPALMISSTLGDELKGLLQSGDVTMRINVIPEPSTSILALLSMVGLGCVRRRRC